MKSVGVREFRDQATQLIASGETLAIHKHGRPVGFFVPIVAKDRRAGAEALDRLGEVVEGVLIRTGYSEEALVEALTEPDADADAACPGRADSSEQSASRR